MSILGLDSAYREALEKSGNNMQISANLVIEMVDKFCELERSVSELKNALLACKNAAQILDKQE